MDSDRLVWLDCRKLTDYCIQNNVNLHGAFHSLQLEVIMETPSIRIRRVLLENLRLRLQQSAKNANHITPATVEDFISDEDPVILQVRDYLEQSQRALQELRNTVRHGSVFGTVPH